MVGGGPVYLDDRQLFFQICVPVGAVSPSRRDALRSLLEPAVAAFRAAGIAARLDDDGEICLGDQKICGHGAGQIEDAVVVCGNLIEAFDHERATRVLALPDAVQRAETLRLMRRYVTATPGDPAVFRASLTDAYASALGLRAAAGELSQAELDRRPAWTTSSPRPNGSPGRAWHPGRAGKDGRSRCAPESGRSPRGRAAERASWRAW